MAEADKTPKPLTAAEAAAKVKRPVTQPKLGKDGKQERDGEGRPLFVTKAVAVKAAEVLDFKDYGTHVVVVTKDGQKFSSADQVEETVEA